jgi:hypothetical protein
MEGQVIGAGGKAAGCPVAGYSARQSGWTSTRHLNETSMVSGLISRIRIWHFGYTCRHNPERIGFEIRRMLVELRGPARWAQMRELMLAGNTGTYPRALGAVAASRWKITNSAEIARVFESLTEVQQERIYSVVNFILPERKS